MQISIGYRRNLPHIPVIERPLFVTYSTAGRWILPPGARTIALRHCVFGHKSAYYLHIAVIMPDHVHVILTLHHQSPPLAIVMKQMKGVAARRINQLLGRTTRVWSEESFDRSVRSEEDVLKKCDYVQDNPVRAGLVTHADEYPWLWRVGIDAPP